MRTNWTQPRRAHGWVCGNESTQFSILKKEAKRQFHRTWQNWQTSGKRRDAKKTGNEATNCVSKFLRSAGKCVTRRTGQSSRAANLRDLGSARVPRAGERVSRSRTLLQRHINSEKSLSLESVSARRRNQHARRVCSPEKMRSQAA